MLEQTKRISFRILSVLSKVEPELGAGEEKTNIWSWSQGKTVYLRNTASGHNKIV